MEFLTDLVMAAAYDCKALQLTEGFIPDGGYKIIENIDFLNDGTEFDQQYKEG